MSNYSVEIDGYKGVDWIKGAITAEEITGSEFLENSVQYYRGRVTNICLFKKLNWGERPKKDIELVEGEVQPVGVNFSWVGVMLVAGSNKVVTVYRKAS